MGNYAVSIVVPYRVHRITSRHLRIWGDNVTDWAAACGLQGTTPGYFGEGPDAYTSSDATAQRDLCPTCFPDQARSGPYPDPDDRA